jgi:hypothetical protein
MDALLSSDCPCHESVSQCFMPMRLRLAGILLSLFSVILEKLMFERGIVQSGLLSRY